MPFCLCRLLIICPSRRRQGALPLVRVWRRSAGTRTSLRTHRRSTEEAKALRLWLAGRQFMPACAVPKIEKYERVVGSTSLQGPGSVHTSRRIADPCLGFATSSRAPPRAPGGCSGECGPHRPPPHQHAFKCLTSRLILFDLLVPYFLPSAPLYRCLPLTSTVSVSVRTPALP